MKAKDKGKVMRWIGQAEDALGAEDVWTGNWRWVFGECELCVQGVCVVFVTLLCVGLGQCENKITSVGLLGSKALPCASLAGATTISGLPKVEVGTPTLATNGS
jgi:hypothetical protein